MVYRWIHKGWKYFWGFILTLLLVVVVLVAGAIGVLQLDVTQDMLAQRIERQVEETYVANLSIGDIDGFIPFQLSLGNVTLTHPDSARIDTLATVQKVNAQIDIWGLLQNKITITGFSVDQPRIWLRSGEKGQLLFLEKKAPFRSRVAEPSGEPWLSEVEVIAPTMEISDGALHLASSTTKTKIGNLPPSFSLTNINARLFMDWGEQQRYLDIESFTATTKNLKVGNLSFSGQLYSDERSLEFNSFNVELGNSRLMLNGEIANVNILQPDFTGQLLDARYNLAVNSEQIYLRDLRDLVPGMPEIEEPVNLNVIAQGTTDSLWIDRADIGLGESRLNANGLVENIRKKSKLAYELRIDHVNFQKPDVEVLFDSLAASQYHALENLTAEGELSGSLDSVDFNLDLSSPLGALDLEGQTQLRSPYKYQAILKGKNVDVSSFSAATFDTTALNFDARLEGEGYSLDKATTQFTATFTDSRIDKTEFELLKLNSSLKKGFFDHDYFYKSGEQQISGSGWINLGQKEPTVAMKGSAENIDLAELFAKSGVTSSRLNLEYNIEFQGMKPERLHGRANIDVKPSVIGGDSVRAHQLYLDLNSPDQQSRTFRLTSSLFDMNVSGHLFPGRIYDQAKLWATYLRNRLRKEILLNGSPDSVGLAVSSAGENIVLDGEFQAKDLGLIQKYFPFFPTISTDSRVNFNVNTDGTRLLLSAEVQADTLHYNDLNFKNGRTQLTASFRNDRTLKKFSTVELEAEVEAMETEYVDLTSAGVDLTLKHDSLQLKQWVGAISDDARFDLTLHSTLSDTANLVTLDTFYLGNKEYAWRSKGTPSFTYLQNGRINFQDFSFQNRNEYLRLQGTLSKNRSDSLVYVLRDINLDRISGLIKGRINFSGLLNGTLLTRSLTRQPTIQGQLDVNRFALNDRMVGDVRFNSRYNPLKDRFDTQINVVTDTTKYSQYLEENDNIGQDIRLDGYFVTPDPEVRQDSVFYFDADFKQIDMWVIPLIVDNIFAEMEGQATGEGYITGNLNDFDFNADFQTRNVFAKPRFVNTNYFINGHVELDRHQGVVLDSLDILDTKGGSGKVWGVIDLNDFKPITYLDLTLDMDELQFLNNKLDPEVPFFGNVSGSGIVKLTGSNTDLYMRTESPVQLTDDSEVSIPLMEETKLNESGKFIHFVDSFENIEKKSATTTERAEEKRLSEDQLEEAIESMTFSERFDLDLQFDATNNITVNLIFDPVTGEILTSEGGGQMRITMQDQDVQMFGRYNINSGNYQFVTGEIISRKLELEPNGNIVWEGPPDNARLDISAVYRARPNVATLISEEAVQVQDQAGGGQQIPVELIVEINGTLNSVENNYYFRLPSSIDLSSNSTLQYTLNQINRDEQQKLLQATSILFTGQFIPTAGAGSGTASLSQSLTRGATVLNPLISNQVISPLLSSQINTLLNSDVSRLDVDFNLNAYNEIDLGIALRLYNDRLILRREGQITGGGPQSTLSDRIGDLNATYRIRRGLSITAFHRQDQVLNSFGAASETGKDVNGIGLETQVHFNTWKDFFNDIGGTFNKIFGKKKKEQEEENSQQEKERKLTEQKAKEEKQEFKDL